jgi:hypothetical protein
MQGKKREREMSPSYWNEFLLSDENKEKLAHALADIVGNDCSTAQCEIMAADLSNVLECPSKYESSKRENL